MKKIFWLIIISGIVLASLAYFYWQKNPFSKDIITLKVAGPEEAELAEEIEYAVTYRNNGDLRLEEARLVFEFPENSILEDSQNRTMEIGPEKLGDIYPGEERTFTFKARLLGREGEMKVAKASLSYKPKNLNARYESSTSLATKIKDLPLNFDFDIQNQVQSGQSLNFSVNYFSRLDQALENLEVKMEYPSDFSFASSVPKSLGPSEWSLPLLEKGEGGRIEIEGRLKGSFGEQKTFKAILGIWLDNDFVILDEVEAAVEIARTDMYISQKINGREKYSASPGETLRYEISFKNTEEQSFFDIPLNVLLESPAFDWASVKVSGGTFNPADKLITFDHNANSKLKFLAPGESGKVEFQIALKQDWQADLTREKNFTAKDIVTISDTREEFETKINTRLELIQRALYNDEAFGNTGPFPVQAGQKTTFTIILQAKNYCNYARNVKVKAILPLNVVLTGSILPESSSSSFSFNSQTREITWNIGDMPVGMGITAKAPDIAFQVSLDAKGLNDTILNGIKIAGEDQFTGQRIEKAFPSISANSIAN